MIELNNIIAKLQQEDINIETKLKFVSLNKDILIAQKNLELRPLLDSFEKRSDREKLEIAILNIVKSDLTKLSLESRASLTDYLRTMTKVNDKSSAELLGQRLVLLAELSPFDFVDLLEKVLRFRLVILVFGSLLDDLYLVLHAIQKSLNIRDIAL